MMPISDDWAESVKTLINEYSWISEIHLLDLSTSKGLADFNDIIPVEWKEYIEATSVEMLYSISSDWILYHKLNQSIPDSFVRLMKRMDTCVLDRTRIDCFDGVYLDQEPFTNEDCRIAGLSRKKYHEVDLLTRIVLHLSRKYSIQTVIDVGSGLGYLTHEIGTKLSVIGVEADERRMYACSERTRKRNLHRQENTKIKLIHGTVDESNLPSLIGSVEDSLLTGLHACGELSVNMIMQFLMNGNFKALVSLGCCYQHTKTIPCSKKFNGCRLSTHSLKLACHSFSNFDQSRLFGLWDHQARRNESEHPETVRKKIAFLTMLRHSFSFCLETMIVLDRYYILKESGCIVHVFPLFSYEISPRNLVIIASKV
jgi:SAM-dependent methyltransferase